MAMPLSFFWIISRHDVMELDIMTVVKNGSQTLHDNLAIMIACVAFEPKVRIFIWTSI